jgi:hypothetical protein
MGKWVMGSKNKSKRKSNSKQDFFTKTKLPEQLLWLADSPLFIDSMQIEAFYDAVVRPYAKLGSITLGRESEIAGELATELNLGAELDSGELLGLLSAWLPKMKITGDGTLSGQGNISRSKNKSAEWTPIESEICRLFFLFVAVGFALIWYSKHSHNDDLFATHRSRASTILPTPVP